MTPRAIQLLDEADRTIASAREELETQGAAVAAQSASTAMLTIAQACLDMDGLAPPIKFGWRAFPRQISSWPVPMSA